MTAKVKLTLSGLTMVLLAATVLPADARPMKKTADWSGPMYALNTCADMGDALVNFDAAIKGSSASYGSRSTGVDFAVRAPVASQEEIDCEADNPQDRSYGLVRALEPGHAYTVWIMAFNHPEFCRGGPEETNRLRCSQADHLNPATGFSIMYGTGGWADRHDLNFRGFREANTLLDVPPDVALGPGLVNPDGAEIHLRIRDHGPAQEGIEDDQISSFRGGCTEDTAPAFFAPREDASYGAYDCVDIHATAS